MWVKYGLTKNTCKKVDIHGGYTLHTSHVCKQFNVGCEGDTPQNLDPAQIVYFTLKNGSLECWLCFRPFIVSHFIVSQDFNLEVENEDVGDFCNNYKLKILICVPNMLKKFRLIILNSYK